MKNSVEQLVELSEVALELEMQELEAMEAPGWATVSGAVASAALTSIAASIGFTVT
ncbi:hypothetical protein JCM3263A_15160 [Thermobifida fusca]|uniref:daptide-type RiPP n=1 Tax=Thermobifida fusca TaxID=2021 RepID=UPI000AD304F0|nr:daptide-type RiPP [Thermobifida fusca]